MANNQGHPPPPPPPPNIRPPGQFPSGQRPQPPPGFRFPGPPGPPGPGGPGPMHVHLPPNIIQQSSRIRDITPQKILTEAECRQKLTDFAAFSIRKVPALPGEKPSWARAEVTMERLDQAEIKKAVKKLGEKGKSVSEKRQALAQFQQGQVTALLDDLASKEMDRNFEWSLVQIDRVERLVPSSKPGKKAIETTVMNLYVKRAPVPGLNAVLLFQNIEKGRLDSLRPPPPQQQPPPPPPPPQESRPPSGHGMRPPSAHGVKMPGGQPVFMEIGKGRPKSPRGKGKEKRYHERDGSNSGSSDSYDSESDSMSDASSSLDTSISSTSGHRPRRHGKATRSHSRHGPKYILEQRRMSPDARHSDAYGVPHHAQHPQHPQHPQHLQHQQQPLHPQVHQEHPPPRPYVPDVPRMVPAIDPITSAYQAGKEDARLELGGERIQSPVPPQPVVIERIIERPPLERVIERPAIEHIIESPRPFVSYARLPERPRFSEPRYLEERYVDELRRDDAYLIQRREAEDHAILREREPRLRRDAGDYIDRRPLDRPAFIGRRPSYSIRGDSSPSLSPTGDFFDRRPSDFGDREFRKPEVRRVFTTPVTPHPFAQVPRRYPASTVSSGYAEPGW